MKTSNERMLAIARFLLTQVAAFERPPVGCVQLNNDEAMVCVEALVKAAGETSRYGDTTFSNCRRSNMNCSECGMEDPDHKFDCSKNESKGFTLPAEGVSAPDETGRKHLSDMADALISELHRQNLSRMQCVFGGAILRIDPELRTDHETEAPIPVDPARQAHEVTGAEVPHQRQAHSAGISKQMTDARGLVWAAERRLQNIVPEKWREYVPLCVLVERDQILSLLREALAALPENTEQPPPPYMNIGVTA